MNRSKKHLKFLFYPYCVLNSFTAALKRDKVGGQAVIEGVMMRSKKAVAWAVRTPGNDIRVESIEYESLSKRIKALGLPLIRGAVSLFESLYLGLKALSRSSEIAMEEEGDEKKEKNSFGDKAGQAASIILALVISFVIFLYTPLKILSYFISQESAFTYNLLAGAVRMVFFLTYIFSISLIKDIRRVFEYHGAEHKCIFTYEDNEALSPENMMKHSRFHPRCGTSFLLIVALICIFIFALIDGIIIRFIGPYPNVIARTLTHILMIPFVSGSSFELLKLSDRFRENRIIGLIIKPGLWLQHLTTREPDTSQLEVAAASLKKAV